MLPRTAILIATLLLAFISNAQVSSIKYKLDYNEVTELYDCKIIIEEGSASSIIERIQLNSQYSVVVPTGSTVEIAELNMPRTGNQFFDSSTPATWKATSIIYQPEILPDNDYYAFSPNLSPSAFYNELTAGDEVILFSLKIISPDLCDRNVRLYNKEIDPTAIQISAIGADFSNGFTLGGINQLYDGNMMPNTGMKAEMLDIEICEGECTTLIPELQCLAHPITYQWSTGETTRAINVCPNSDSYYTLDVTDGHGETITIETIVSVNETGSGGCEQITPTSDQSVEVKVYPNPTNSTLNIKNLNDKSQAYIMNSSGAVLNTEAIQNEASLDFSDYPSGIYVLNIKSADTYSSHKIHKL